MDEIEQDDTADYTPQQNEPQHPLAVKCPNCGELFPTPTVLQCSACGVQRPFEEPQP